MRFRILGPLEIWTGQGWSGIGAAKWRALLAALLLNPGQVVSTERLIAELWDDRPPDRAANLISIYVLRIRRLIGDPKGGMLATRSPGYQLRLEPGDVDASCFEQLASRGRQALTDGDAPGAAALLAEALALWRGDALVDVPPSGLVSAESDRLGESRLTAIELRITADFHCGVTAGLVPELRRLISDHPLREGLWVLLLASLDHSGRRAEAISAYGEARKVIADELGVDPGPELRQVYSRLLAADATGATAGAGGAAVAADTAAAAGRALAAGATAGAGAAETAGSAVAGDSALAAGTAAAAAGTAAAAKTAVGAGTAAAAAVAAGAALDAGTGAGVAPDQAATADPSRRVGTAAPTDAAPFTASTVVAARAPAQLPADIADFTGRATHLSQLQDLLAGPGGTGNPAAVTVAVVAGAPGLGKTALAVHAAHALRRDFPDGQLYVSLLGASKQPVVPDEVLARLLRDLGVSPDQIPAGQEERAALYRTRLTDRRVLIVLDDAADAAQVRPLLPGSASCAVIVTSRHRLAELAGSRLVDLDVLDDDEARGLLTAIIGDERAAAEPGPVREVLTACAGLPLAIRIAGARLTARRGWAVRTLARRLADQRRRVDELKSGDLAVRACFDVSFDSLRHLATGDGVDPAHAFRLLGLWQGSRISLQAAAALLGQPEDLVADALEVLVDTCLLESPEPEWYRFHDLLRAYAAERAVAEEPAQTPRAATARLLRWYLQAADAAASVINPLRDRVPLDAGLLTHAALDFDAQEAALQWTARERANLVAATRQAAAEGLHDVAWKLPVAIMLCFDLHGYRAECLAAHEVALASARTAGDRGGEAWVLNNIGVVLSQQGALDTHTYFEQALDIRRELGDLRGQAQAANNLAFSYQFRGMHEHAVPPLRDALALQRQIAHRYGECVALCNLGEAFLELGRYPEAIACEQDALAIVEKIGPPRLKGYVLQHLGRAHRDSGSVAKGAALLEQALASHRADGDKYGEAQDLQHVGQADAQLGRIAEAQRALERAAELFESLGDEARAARMRSALTGLSASGAPS